MIRLMEACHRRDVCVKTVRDEFIRKIRTDSLVVHMTSEECMVVTDLDVLCDYLQSCASGEAPPVVQVAAMALDEEVFFIDLQDQFWQ